MGDWIPDRPTDGAYTAFLEFEDGTPATVVFSGYGHFDSAELHYWIGEGGTERDPDTNRKAHEAIKDAVEQGDEAARKETMRYAGSREGDYSQQTPRELVQHQPFFGITLVSCEKAGHPPIPRRPLRLRGRRQRGDYPRRQDAWPRSGADRDVSRDGGEPRCLPKW